MHCCTAHAAWSRKNSWKPSLESSGEQGGCAVHSCWAQRWEGFVRVLSCRAERWVGRFERVPSCTTVPCCLQLQADHHPLMPDSPGGKTTQPQLALHHDAIMIGTPQLALSHDVWVSALLPVATFVWIWGQKKRKHYDDVCTKNNRTRQGVFSWFYSVLF